MNPFVNIAVQAARKAGKLILNGVENLDRLKIAEKSVNDFVTNVDKAVENDLIQSIHKAYPKHTIIGEESGEVKGTEESDVKWIIDPVDGTNNFIHGFPQFAIAISIEVKGVIEHGVVYDPFKNEIFSASKGRGAQLDGRRIRVSNCKNLKTALVSTTLHHIDNDDASDTYLNNFSTVVRSCLDVRLTGSAALELAYVACGRLDAYYGTGLKVWDFAAGSLFVTEAGGFVSDFDGKKDFLEKGEIIAAPPKIHEALKNIVA